MSDFKFVPKITFKNTALITGPALKHLRVPGGVQAYDPIRVDFGRMSVLDENRVPAPAGLTEAGAGAELPDVEKVGTGNTKLWKFTGGDIVLNIEIAVYIIDKYAPVPALFKVIMEHEYLHVLDYQDLAKSPRLRKLIETDEKLKPWHAGETWSDRQFYDRVEQIWGDEAKRLGKIRDTGPTYERHKQEIIKLAPRI